VKFDRHGEGTRLAAGRGWRDFVEEVFERNDITPQSSRWMGSGLLRGMKRAPGMQL